jgi:hypothetical protein
MLAEEAAVMKTVCACVIAAVLAGAGAVHAQESRAELLKEARLKREQSLVPYETSLLERALTAIEKGGVPLITRDGIYLKLGSLTTGSGFAYGAGYRSRRLLEGTAAFDAWAGASMTKYWAAEARLRFPRLAGGHLDLQSYARRHEYPQEDFFGLGGSSRRDAHSDFSIRSTMLGARAAWRPAEPAAVGGGVEFLRPRVGDGTDDGLPSIGERFDARSAPGLAAQPDFLRAIAFVDLDWRRPLNARKGGWYRAEFSRFDDRNGSGYTFNRLDVDLRHFVSFLSERRVFFGRAFASTSDVSSGQQVPFYLMPWLGGNDSLRGFREYRFRGPHALLLQGEYRFEIWSGLDGALFYDTGKVTTDRRALDFRNLERDYGFGFRFNTDNGIVFRVDSAFGSRDGKHLWIVFGGTF